MIALVCRGCCCGTRAKHPDVDHDAHLDRLVSLASVGVPVEVTDCLGPCRWSNVVVAVDPDADDEQHWFTKVLHDRDLAAVARWIADPGRAPYPHHLVRTPPRRDRIRARQIAVRAAAT